MKKACKIDRLSIRQLVVITFMATLILSIGVTSTIIFATWTKSATTMTRHLSATMMQSIYAKTDNALELPDYINKTNHKVIEDGMLDITNQQQRDKFFAELLSEHSERVYSIAYATAQGGYYGARRGKEGGIEVLISDATTSNSLLCFKVKDNFELEQCASDLGSFDPRQRPWYVSAYQNKAPTYAPIYRHIVADTLTIAASYPILVGDEFWGVLVTNIFIDDMQDDLIKTVDGSKGMGIIFEKDSGYLIANSFGIDNYKVDEQGVLSRVAFDTNRNELYGAYQKYLESN